jgi:translocation and assembly module TamB
MAKNGRSSGLVDVSMSSGTIVNVARPDLQLETGAASLRFRIDSNSLHSGVLNVPLTGLGQVAAQFDVLGVAGDGSAALQGTIDVDVADVRFVEALIPALDDVKGRLAADFFVSGPFSQPVVTGEFTLDEGGVSYVPIGLELTQLSLDGEIGASGNIEMTGSFMAGDGHGRIRTHTNQFQTARTGLQIELRGENLTLIDVPDLRAVADTDVTVGFDGETLQLHGKVDVPYARIKPQNIGINRISESDDVVVVKGELPEGPADTESDTEIYFNGAVELSLGKDVVVELDVADANLSGSAIFTWDGPPMPMADGRYILNGQILAYGQNLEISEGAIRFPNVPAYDPYLRIRAEREIFGNTQVRRAGVLVSGSATRPTIEAYTTPMTTEERALTLLVTGSEFDYEKGVGAFDFGTYIAPRVYASYGIGLFDQENVIRVRYDLTEGFGLALTSGARDEGVDLTYRISN